MNEFYLIKKYFKINTLNNPSAKNLNDDVFFDKKKKLVVSVDTYNEGVHFLNFKFPSLVIKKVIRSSISDLYAKGVTPVYYFLSGSGNKNHFTKKNLILISNSLKQEQKKFNLKLSGGDTTKSNHLSFTIITIGFSDRIIERNKAKLNDDIYVTGDIGDSYVGLKILKENLKASKLEQKYFLNKFYCPKLSSYFPFAIKKLVNTSIDISDGLITDMYKLINNQKFSFIIDVEKIPTSKQFHRILINNNKSILDYLFNGDDYQILFTADKSKRKQISQISKKLKSKITRIGKINNVNKKNLVIFKGNSLNLSKYQGYSHKFS